MVRQGGFTYLAVILLVAMMGAGLGATGQVWRTAQQREKERELIFIGNEYRQAIGRYVEHGPGGIRRFPPRLEDLLSDSRSPGIQRYLRRLYRDPMTGGTDWGLVRASDGGIAGVYSKSEQKPLKIAGFTARDTRLERADKYSDWLFVYEGRMWRPPLPPRGTPPGPSTGEPPMMFPE
ncbi:MAG TPA: type II secretion system protein [Rhodocyclaceae bacterium]|nr:type II secretion system protein [Rhodocyclaceae bacterium]